MKWPTSSLDSIAILDRQSIHPSDVDAATPYLGLEHLDGDGGIDCTQTIGYSRTQEQQISVLRPSRLIRKAPTVSSKDRQASFQVYVARDIIPILPKEGVSRDYLFYFLRTPDIVNLATSRCSGVNLPRLSPKQLASFRIPLPPFDEQRRIAEDLGQGGRAAGQAPGRPRPTRHPHPIHLPRYVWRPRHESEGMAGGGAAESRSSGDRRYAAKREGRDVRWRNPVHYARGP